MALFKFLMMDYSLEHLTPCLVSPHNR